MCQQRTLEWFANRLGKVTASKVSAILTNSRKSGELSQTAKTYMLEIISERLTGIPKLIGKNIAIEHGVLYEPEAIKTYEYVTKTKVNLVGSIDNPTFKYTSGSPDGLVDYDGIIEVKCPNTANHINTVLTDNIKKEYIAQCQFNLWNTGRSWCDFISYDPRIANSEIKIHIIRIERNDAYIKNMIAKLTEFHTIMNKMMIDITGKESFEIDKEKLEMFLLENNEIEVDLDFN